MLNVPVLPAVRSMQDVQSSFELMRTFFTQLQQIFAGLDNLPTTGQYVVLIDPDGNLQAYQVIAGAGVTITVDSVNKTWTLSSP